MRIAVDALAVRSTSHGIGRYATGILRGLVQVGGSHQYTAFIRSDAIDAFAGVADVVALRVVDLAPAARVIWEQVGLPIALRRLNIDVLLGAAFVVPVAQVCPQVVVIHDLTFYSEPQLHTARKRYYFRAMIPLAMRSARRVLAVSQSTADDIERRFPWTRSRLRTVLEGVDDQLFRQVDVDSARASISVRFGINSPFVMSVGVPEPRKNLDVVVKAFLALPRDLRDRKLVLVGNRSLGWKSKGVVDLINAAPEGSILFLENVDDVALVELLNACELFAYVPRYEGFGLPVLESMACGAATITTRVASLPEVGGDAVIYVAPGDVPGLTAAMSTLLRDAQARSALKGRGIRRAQSFSWKSSANETLRVLGEAAATSTSL
jgi:glycosyltransferase involved in cell wall biosynthesis